MSDKTTVAATAITLTRAEGPNEACGTCTFTGERVWAQARAQLVRWSLTAPGAPGTLDLGVDKTDFTVTYADGAEYKGCFGLRFDDTDLGAHIRGFLESMLKHNLCEGTEADDVRDFLARYEIGNPATDPVST